MSVNKPVKWLPLDVDALEDPKVMALVMALGLEGYGIYIMLIQFLAKQEPLYITTTESLKYIAYHNHVSEEKIKAVVQGFGLFEFDGDSFYSNSLTRRMERYDNLKLKNKERAEKRWEKTRKLCHGNATALPAHCPGNAEKRREEKNRIENNTKQKRRSEKSTDNPLPDVSYVDNLFSPSWTKWLSYKTELGDPYKTASGAKTQYNHLVSLSGHNPDLAMLIVDQSIAYEWKGLFALKEKPALKIIPGENAIQRMLRQMHEQEKLEKEDGIQKMMREMDEQEKLEENGIRKTEEGS
jgi:uncharacterized protein YdaU (DUF1376 family)